jgi:hypothetical protein
MLQILFFSEMAEIDQMLHYYCPSCVLLCRYLNVPVSSLSCHSYRIGLCSVLPTSHSVIQLAWLHGASLAFSSVRPSIHGSGPCILLLNFLAGYDIYVTKFKAVIMCLCSAALLLFMSFVRNI